MSVIAQDGWYGSEMRLTARSLGRTEAMRHAKTLGTRVFIYVPRARQCNYMLCDVRMQSQFGWVQQVQFG